MRRRQIAQAAHLEMANIVHYVPKVLPDCDHMVMGKEEFHSFRFSFVGKAHGIKTGPGHGPFLGLQRAKSDHRGRLEFSFYTASSWRGLGIHFGKLLS